MADGRSTPRPATAVDDAWSLPAADVGDRIGADVDRGLSSQEAAARLATCGANDLATTEAETLWRRLARQFTDPLVVLLLVAIAISLTAWLSEGRPGAPLEAVVIAIIVAANAAIGTWQEARAINAVEALRRLGGTHSTVVRDGRRLVIPRRDLVPGDTLLLAQGDAVGADVRIVESASLAIAEAALTGESEPVAKSVEAVPKTTELADRRNMAYQGTTVTLGRGVGVVVATGMESAMGRIAQLIDDAETAKTPLQKQIEWLGRVLGLTVIVLAVVVVLTVVATSEVSTFADVVDALLIGVSLAVAAVPEGLPAILTIVLAMGVQRMATNRAVVKRLSSVETLGCASVICSDKTGTLTRNEMSIVTVVTATGAYDITDGSIDRRPLQGQGATVDDAADRADDVEAVIRAGSIANDAAIGTTEDGRRELQGDPTEVAFLIAERELGLGGDRDGCSTRIGEIPFDSDRKLMTTINEQSGGREGGDDPSDVIAYTKGAADVLLGLCTHERFGASSRTLTTERRDEIMRIVGVLAGQALRTLAVAYRPIAGGVPDRTRTDWTDVESDLTLLGVVGIVDPPRPEAAQAVAQAHAGGVRVLMITGDHPLTAARIAVDLGIDDVGGRVATGAELSELEDAELEQVVSNTNVFARVAPEHKLRLVRALQRRGHITAMTGDGVNDAPALKQADIGVAMGISGTEVSKDAADMILADDNFATILRAVREGREIFANIQKFLRYLLVSNTGEVLVVLLGVVFASAIGITAGGDDLAIPLLATQILWINLVTDGALALALGVDPPVEDVMTRPPRRLDERVVDAPMVAMMAVVGLATALVSLAALDLHLPGGLFEGSGDLETARTMTFTTVVLAQVFNAFSARSASVSAFVEISSNRLLWGAVVGTVAAQVAVVHLPGLSAAFGTEALTAGEWATCTVLSSLVLVVAELHKVVVRRTKVAKGPLAPGPRPASQRR